MTTKEGWEPSERWFSSVGLDGPRDPGDPTEPEEQGTRIEGQSAPRRLWEDYEDQPAPTREILSLETPGGEEEGE